MSPFATVRLIAGREVRQRLRSRLFVWTTVALSALLCLLALLPLAAGLVRVVDADQVTETMVIAVVGELGTAQRAAIRDVVGRAELSTVPTERAARQLVEAGDAELAVIDGERLLERPPESLIGIGADHAAELAEALAFARMLDAAGLSADEVSEVLGAERLTIEVVGDFDPGQRLGQLLLANLGVVFLLAVLATYVTMIVNGTIEEKGSRVVELLIETVPVRQLMTGKLIGLGVVGLGQTLVLFGPAAAIIVLAGTLTLPEGAAGPLLVILGWFLLGYAFYSVVAAALGSLVSRPEEAQAVMTPTSVLMVTGYLMGFFAINAPDGRLASVAGWIPPTAPYVMLDRQLVGAPSVFEVVGAAAVVVVATVVLARVAARIYEGGILRMGARVRLRDAWSDARQ